MKPNLLLVIFALILCAGLALVTCGDDDDDDDDDEDDDDGGNDDDGGDDDDASGAGDTWTDSSSGLMWQNGSEILFLWGEARLYCEFLEWGDYSDWRLPTISELRSLIRGCEATELGGSCGITDACLEYSDCWNDACEGCPSNEGPADGIYWPSEFNDVSYTNWSSSNFDWINLWLVSFRDGKLMSQDIRESYYPVRCVR